MSDRPSPATPNPEPAPTYLHTWGSRRHIAASIDSDGKGIALCGQSGCTEERRFRGLVPSRRKRAGILNRPICSNCAVLADPAPAPGEAETGGAWECSEHMSGAALEPCDERMPHVGCLPAPRPASSGGTGRRAPSPFDTWSAGMFEGLINGRNGMTPQDYTEYDLREGFRLWLQERADGEIPEAPSGGTGRPGGDRASLPEFQMVACAEHLLTGHRWRCRACRREVERQFRECCEEMWRLQRAARPAAPVPTGGEPGSLHLGAEDRFHLWAHINTIHQETEAATFGQSWPIARDHIHEEAACALAYLDATDPPARPVSTGERPPAPPAPVPRRFTAEVQGRTTPYVLLTDHGRDGFAYRVGPFVDDDYRLDQYERAVLLADAEALAVQINAAAPVPPVPDGREALLGRLRDAAGDVHRDLNLTIARHLLSEAADALIPATPSPEGDRQP